MKSLPAVGTGTQPNAPPAASGSRATLRTALIYTTVAVLAICLVKEMKHRGGAFFKVPATIESHTWDGQNDTQDVIMLCRRARVFIPRAATVTIIRPSQGPNYEATVFLAGVGNLPRHRVLAPHMNAASEDLPQYVIAVREPLSDPRYVKSAEFPEGTLWVRKR